MAPLNKQLKILIQLVTQTTFQSLTFMHHLKNVALAFSLAQTSLAQIFNKFSQIWEFSGTKFSYSYVIAISDSSNEISNLIFLPKTNNKNYSKKQMF